MPFPLDKSTVQLLIIYSLGWGFNRIKGSILSNERWHIPSSSSSFSACSAMVCVCVFFSFLFFFFVHSCRHSNGRRRSKWVTKGGSMENEDEIELNEWDTINKWSTKSSKLGVIVIPSQHFRFTLNFEWTHSFPPPTTAITMFK